MFTHDKIIGESGSPMAPCLMQRLFDNDGCSPKRLKFAYVLMHHLDGKDNNQLKTLAYFSRRSVLLKSIRPHHPSSDDKKRVEFRVGDKRLK